MKAHKTFAGMVRAVERTIAELESGPIADDRQYREMAERVKDLHRELAALWSNPADVADTKKLANRLNDAWHKATA